MDIYVDIFTPGNWGGVAESLYSREQMGGETLGMVSCDVQLKKAQAQPPCHGLSSPTWKGTRWSRGAGRWWRSGDVGCLVRAGQRRSAQPGRAISSFIILFALLKTFSFPTAD